jgi:hypothetical protein
MTKEERRVRRIWLYLLAGGVGLQLISFFIEKQYALTLVSLGFSFTLYYLSYKRRHTWPLTFLLWFYAVTFVVFCGAMTSLYMMGVMFRQTGIEEHLQFWPICTGIVSIAYLISFLYYSYKLRKINKIHGSHLC